MLKRKKRTTKKKTTRKKAAPVREVLPFIAVDKSEIEAVKKNRYSHVWQGECINILTDPRPVILTGYGEWRPWGWVNEKKGAANPMKSGGLMHRIYSSTPEERKEIFNPNINENYLKYDSK